MGCFLDGQLRVLTVFSFTNLSEPLHKKTDPEMENNTRLILAD